MAQFLGRVEGKAGPAQRLGSSRSGLKALAASWQGAVEVDMWTDDKGVDHYRVVQRPWQGSGVSETLAEGIVGEYYKKGGEK